MPAAKLTRWMLPLAALLLLGASKSCDEVELGGRLRFDADTTAIGRTITAHGSLVYPRGWQRLPLDTPKAVQPFELLSLDTLARGLSRDSIFDSDTKRPIILLADSFRLTLRTFSAMPVQRLALRYRVIDTTATPPDTVVAITTEDSIRVNLRWPNPPPADAQPLFDYTLNPLSDPFDWQGLFLLVAVVGLVGAVATYFLRTPVLRWLARRRLERDWAQLRAELSRLTQLAPTQADQALTQLNHLWMTRLAHPRGLTLESLTADELPKAVAESDLASARDTLVALRRAEARAAFARLPIDPAELQRLLAELDALLTADYTRQRRALS